MLVGGSNTQIALQPVKCLFRRSFATIFNGGSFAFSSASSFRTNTPLGIGPPSSNLHSSPVLHSGSRRAALWVATAASMFPFPSESEPDMRQPSRRQAMKILAGAPMLPLGGTAATSLLAALRRRARRPRQIGRLRLRQLHRRWPAPSLADPAAMATTTVGSDPDRDDERQHHPAASSSPTSPSSSPATWCRTARAARSWRAATTTSTTSRSSTNRCRARNAQFFSDSPDGTSLLALPNPTVPGIKGKAVFAVVQFEYTTRDQSGADTYRRPAVADRRAHARPGPGAPASSAW